MFEIQFGYSSFYQLEVQVGGQFCCPSGSFCESLQSQWSVDHKRKTASDGDMLHTMLIVHGVIDIHTSLYSTLVLVVFIWYKVIYQNPTVG